MKHLEFIQNIINRMNSNSLTIKGWAVTIVSALFAISASTNESAFLLVSIIPTIFFWMLDTLYLQNERKFRSLYNEAIKENSSVRIFEISLKNEFIEKDNSNHLLNVFRSSSLLPFYVLLLITAVACYKYLGVKSPADKDKVVNVKLSDTLKVKVIDLENKHKIFLDTTGVNTVDTVKMQQENKKRKPQ